MAQHAEQILSNLWKLNVMDIEKTVEKVANQVLQVGLFYGNSGQAGGSFGRQAVGEGGKPRAAGEC